MDDFVLETPDIPDFPEVSDLPDLPDSPEIVEIPDAPDIPESPPERGSPDNPDLPGHGEMPESPELPGSGEMPDSHDAFPIDKPDVQSPETKPEAVVTSAEASNPSPEGKPDTISTGSRPETIHPEDEVRPESMEPNSTYERNGYECQTNEFGHTRLVSGDLKLEEGHRTHLQTEVGQMGLAGDEGGHLIGTRFDGPTDAFNLVPQNANLNRGEWNAMEHSWAENLAQGKDVKVMIEPIYNGNTVRPDSFDVLSQVNGELTYTSFHNQASAASPKEK